jgi:hypothetical protein
VFGCEPCDNQRWNVGVCERGAYNGIPGLPLNVHELWHERGVGIEMGRVFRCQVATGQLPLPGSYSSAEARALPPPTTRTVPSGSSVAVWEWRARLMLPVAVQVSLQGS